MAEKYTYPYSNFLYNKANLSSLSQEIGDSDIAIALDYINSDNAEVDVWFKAVLPSADETTLSGRRQTSSSCRHETS